MKSSSKISRMALAVVAVAGIGLSARLVAQETAHWTGAATVHGQQVPVSLELGAAKDGHVTGSFLNGGEVSTSSSGELQDGHLVLKFDYFARKLEGTVTGDAFSGTFGGATGTPVPVELHRELEVPVESAAAKPKIDGDWEIAVKSPKGESAWTLRVTPRSDGQVKAVILRIDGDTGGLYGGFDASAGAYRVGHFGAAGAALYSLKPAGDGTLVVTNLLKDAQQWTARRPAEARKENLAGPTKATEQTGVVDPAKPLGFSATDLQGATVTNADARFKGKVVIVAIGGSWCPNCHDEAPFLVELYKRYHARGLEIVDLSFEEDDQLKNPERLRAFVARYQIPYTVLLGGTPDQLNSKLPQGKNLNCWPTAFFVGRDGLVKETHAGFSGPATGQAYVELKAETSALVERLLAANAVAQR
jgi:thiol-disulfide isomerase/thioredoxin